MEVKKIIVIGIGNNGKNVINYMYESFLEDGDSFYKDNVDLCLIDINKNSIDDSKISDNIFLENDDLDEFLTREKIIEIANNNKEKIRSKISVFDIVFVVAGIGGNTGRVITNLVCDICKEEDKILILNVLKPFNFEEKERSDNFVQALVEIKDKTNGILVISNEQSLGYSNFSFKKVLENNYKKIFDNIKSIVDLFLKQGVVTMSVLELKNFFHESNFLSIGNAFDCDQNRISEAIDDAIFSQSTEIDISEAKKMICIISCYSDISFSVVNDCLDLISNKIYKADAKVVVLNDKNVKPGRINVTIIGNNFEKNLINDYFVTKNNQSDKVKNIINVINDIFEDNKNETIEEKDILPFFIKKPDNKYGSKK